MPKSVVTFLLGLLLLAGSAPLLTGCDRGDQVQLLLEAKRKEPSAEAMDKAREVIERRLGTAGMSGVTVVRHGPNRLLATFRGARDMGSIKVLIGRSARLEFRLVDLGVAPEELDAGQAPPGTRILPYASDGPGGRIAVRRRPVVDGSMIVDAQPGFDSDGQPTVNLRFDEAGSRRFAQATRENVGRPFAIVLDDLVLSAPNINEPILGGQAQINGGFTPESARDLAVLLRSGALPFDLVVVGERVVKE
jgi:preprotein translocase subunit SecD